jgi:RNA recognition motif-containing protein
MNTTETRGRSRRGRRNGRPARTPERPEPAPQGFFDKILALFGFGKKRPGPIRQERRSSAPPTARRDSQSPRQESRKPEMLEVTSGRLYVGNLSYDAAESDLLELFNGVGQVQSAEVVTNRHTQRSKGFAFVQMQSIEEAKRAVDILHDKEFMGRKLVVSGARLPGSDD